MSLNHRFKELDLRFLLILVLYLSLGLLLLKYYQYQINPDGIGYLTRSEAYLAGNFNSAIDSYWGPLITWLLIPFLVFGKSQVYELLSTKILSLMVGLVTLVGVRFLLNRFEMDNNIKTVILLSLVPIILYFAYSVITPDLLVTCALIYYLYYIFDPDYYQKKSNAVLCGIIGSIAYFGKSFALPFFLLHFTVFNCYYYLSNKNVRKKIIKNLARGLLVFFLISGIWITIISEKEDQLTFGTSGGINYALVGPDSQGYPAEYGGFNTDTQKYYDELSWSPLDSWSNFKYQIKIIWNNILKELAVYQIFSYFSIIILLFFIILCFKPLRYLIKDRDILYPLTTLIILSSLFLPIVVEERYLWLSYLLLLVMSGVLINKLWNTETLNKLAKFSLLVIVCLSFVYMPINFLNDNINLDKDVYELSMDLKSNYHISGNLAANDHNNEMYFISFYLKTKSYGKARENITYDELKSELNQLNIDYYFVWGNPPINQQLGLEYPEITHGQINDLRIYRMKESLGS